MKNQVVASLLVVVASIAVNAAAIPLVFSRGLAWLATPLGLVAQVPFLVVIALLVRLVLRRFRGLDTAALGVAPLATARAIAPLVVGLAFPVVAAGALVLKGHGTFTPASLDAGLVGALVVGALSTAVNAALQDVTLVGLALAASSSTSRVTRGAFAVSVAFFVFGHLPVSQAPVYVVNVALFGALALLFFEPASTTRSFLSTVAFHTGTNVSFVFFIGSPTTEGVTSLLGLTGTDETWSGGAAGLESGAVLVVVYAILLAALLVYRRRRAARA